MEPSKGAPRRSGGRAEKWREAFIDLGIIAAMMAAAYAPQVFTPATFELEPRSGMNDMLTLAQPGYVYTGRSLARGQIPLWNPHWFAGYPHLAVPSNGVFYPTTILFGLLNFGVALKIVVLGHVLAGAIASYGLGRDLYRARVPALFLAFCAIDGSIVWRTLDEGHPWTLMTLTWMPLAFLLLRRILRTGRAVWGILLVPVVALMILAGDPQTTAYVLLWLGAYTGTDLLLRLAGRRESWRAPVFKGVVCLAAVLFGGLLAAAQLVPGQELVEQSVRKDGVTYEYFWGLFGSGILDHYTSQAFFELDPGEGAVFAGKVTLALVFVSFFAGAIPEVLALWAAVAVCFVYGDASRALFENFIRHVPAYGGFRGSGRIGGMVVYLSYLLAGFGLRALAVRSDDRRGRRLPWTLAGLAAAAMLAVPVYRESPVSWPVVATVVAMLALSAAVLWRPWPGGRVALALAAIVVAEGARLNAGTATNTDPGLFEVDGDLARFSRDRKDLDRILIVPPPSDKPNHGPGVTLLTGDRNVEGYHALFLYRYARLLRELGGVSLAITDERGRLADQGDYGGDWVSLKTLAVLDRLNIRHIVRSGAPVALLNVLDESGFRRFSPRVDASLHLYLNHDALPPMYPIHDAIQTASDAEALELLRGGAVDPRKRVTLPPGAPAPELAPATGRESVTLLQYGPNEIASRVHLTAPALLVISEMWYPGWSARIDGGKLQPTLCVDTALQAIPVGAGEHTVEFVFRPRSVYRGLAISAASFALWLAACLGLLAAWIRRKRSSTP